MSIANDIAQAARTWFKATAISGTPLTNAQCILANQSGPRPPLPYAVVEVLVPDIVDGPDEVQAGVDGSGNPTQMVEGPRRATVSVTTFGATSADWIGRATACLPLDSTISALSAAGYGAFTIVPQGGAAQRFDAPTLDTARVPTFSRDFDVLYLLQTETETLTPLDYAETTLSTTGSGSALSTTLTSTVP